MAPSITFGDAGELSSAAALLGLPHSPGYPLYVLLGKAAGSILRIGGWAYRTNLASAACSAAALALLWLAIRNVGISALAAAGGVLPVALSSAWRTSAASTEVFSLHWLCIGALCALALAPGGPWGERRFAGLGLIAGLGLANHHTLLLAAPALAWEAWDRRPRPARMAACWGAGLLLAGVMCYAFLPIRSWKDPPLDWGDPTSLARFSRVLTRSDYGSLSLTVEGSAGSLGRLGQLVRFSRETAAGLGFAACAAAAVGAFLWRGLGLRVSWRFPALLAFCAGPFFLFLANAPSDPQTSYALERFYPAAWMGLAFFAAAGAEALARWRSGAAAALLLLVCVERGVHWREWHVRADFAAYDYGRNILRSLPRDAALFIDGGDDTFYTLAHLAFAERRRPDVLLQDRAGLVFRGAYGQDFRWAGRREKDRRRREIESSMLGERPVYYSTLRGTLIDGVALIPEGLVRRAIPEGGKAPRADPWEVYARRWDEDRLRRHYRDRALAAFYPFMRAVADAREGRGEDALRRLRQAMALAPDALWLPGAASHEADLLAYDALQAKDLTLAESGYRAALRWEPRDAGRVLNLGAVLQRQGRLDAAQDEFERAVALDPRSALAWHNLGSLHWERRRWGEAAGAFERLVALSPENQDARKFRDEARRRSGK